MKIIKHLFLSLLLLLPLASFAEPININTADKETLMTISGVGEKKAEAIIRYREKNGPFKSVDDLSNIKGIGENTLDKQRDVLTVADN